MKRSLGALLLLLLLPGLTGCWNKTEIEEAAYVLALGIDRGEQSHYKLTIAIAKPDKIVGGGGKGGGGGGGEEKAVMLTSVEAPSLSGALTTLNSYIGRSVNFNHARVLFFHEELARGEGIKILDELVRFRQTRETIFFVVTKEPAADFLKELNPQLEKNPIKYIEQLTYNYSRSAMLPATSQLSAIASRLNVKYAEPLTYYAALAGGGNETQGRTSSQAESDFRAGQLPREGGANVEMVGAAAFRENRMVGILSGEETRYLLMLQNHFQQTYVAFKDPRSPDQYVSVQLRRGRGTRITGRASGERSVIRGLVTLEAEILGIESGIDYSKPENQLELEQAITRQIQEPLQRFIARTQEWESDVAGLGSHLISHFPTVASWEKFDWPRRFPDADIKVDVRVTLRRFGLTLSPITAR